MLHPYLGPLPVIFVLAGKVHLLKAFQYLADTPSGMSQHWFKRDPWEGRKQIRKAEGRQWIKELDRGSSKGYQFAQDLLLSSPAIM